MSTLDDVFYLYERNSRHYNVCPDIGTCPDKWDNECLCYLKQIIYPSTIGDQDVPFNSKIKCYIKPGDECPICFDPILTKSSAFITHCGHAFHKKCLHTSIRMKWESCNYLRAARCPMCRCSLGHPEFVQRYRDSYFAYHGNGNELDKLEDFWVTMEYKIPNFCNNRYDHYLGTDKECVICQNYVLTGNCE